MNIHTCVHLHTSMHAFIPTFLHMCVCIMYMLVHARVAVNIIYACIYAQVCESCAHMEYMCLHAHVFDVYMCRPAHLCPGVT